MTHIYSTFWGWAWECTITPKEKQLSTQAGKRLCGLDTVRKSLLQFYDMWNLVAGT
jgi:hypothetical protein